MIRQNIVLACHAGTVDPDRLLAEEIFNANLVLLVVTSLAGPVLTELFTPGMITEEAPTKKATV